MGLFDAAESAMADLEGRVAALEGETVEPPETDWPPETWPTVPDSSYIEEGDEYVCLDSGMDIHDRLVYGPYPGDPSYYGYNSASNEYSRPFSNVKLKHIWFQHCQYGIKLGQGAVASNLDFDDLVIRDCRQGIYMSQVEDSTFTRLDVESLTGNAQYDHCLYLSDALKNLTFQHLHLTADGGWGLHLYNGYWYANQIDALRSDGMTFDDVLIDGGGTGHGLIVCGGYKNITITNLVMKNITPGYNCIQIEDGTNVVIDGFDIEGGYCLFEATDVNYSVTLRNGIYRGSGPLVQGNQTGLTLENVVRA